MWTKSVLSSSYGCKTLLLWAQLQQHQRGTCHVQGCSPSPCCRSLTSGLKQPCCTLGISVPDLKMQEPMNTVLPYKAGHSIWGQNSTHFSHISFKIHSKLVNLNDRIHAQAKWDQNKMSDVNVHTQSDLCQHLTSQYLGWAMCLHKALCSAASHHQLRKYTASQGEIFCEKFHPLHLSSDAPNHIFFKQETAPVSGSFPSALPGTLFCT